MKFYMTPGSCSTGIHILLEELELFFEAHLINLLAGDHYKPEYLAINPRGSVPALVKDDGTALTSFQSIALWLAEHHPKRMLMPTQEAERARVLSVLDYAVTVIHGEGFTRIFVSGQYAADPAEKREVTREGRALVERGFARLVDMLGPATYVSERFSVADAALFYVEFWADREGIPMPPRLARHYTAMLQRPAVRQVLGEEGYHSTLRAHPATALA
jgi:glutathione S-transferase